MTEYCIRQFGNLNLYGPFSTMREVYECTKEYGIDSYAISTWEDRNAYPETSDKFIPHSDCQNIMKEEEKKNG